ncbi:hypothetical protein P2G88_08960 [Aliiglaciecola sp. CAU 1673]|uniref:hypothetical protein n=1 Tax=Aliiglaciecola sp. CAU 1673 TaxID=3032595 RepID=UPI0023D9E88D|nr:hypothetical protein [Aliiglaciecola sp. CAU 1673]MDF2178380.1 hypothetical protein [Aliiglaciecola sp. CAU 1673]
MSLKHLIVGLLTLLALSGCATSSHVLTGEARAPIDPDEVMVYRNAPADYQEIARLKATSKFSWSLTEKDKINKAIERMKMEAAALGANGVLLQYTEEQITGSVGTGAGGVDGNVGIGVGMSWPMVNIGAGGIAIYVPPAQENE